MGHHYRSFRGAKVRRHASIAADLVEPKLSFNYVCDLAFTPDGSTLVAGSNLPIVRLWDTATRSKKLVLDNLFHNKVSSVAISPDGILLAAGADDWRVAVWKVKSGKLAYVLTGHKGWVNSVTFSPDGRTLATGAMDDSIILSNAVDGHRISSIDNMSGVNSVDFWPDCSAIAAASTDETIKIWSIVERTTGALRVLEGHTGSVNSVKISPKGGLLASGSDDKSVKLWDTSTDEVRTLEGHTNKIWTVAFTPDARHVISGSEDRTVRVWDVKSGETVHSIIDHTSGLNSVAISPNGRYLASSSFDDEVRLYDAHTWEPQGFLQDLESQNATEIMERTLFKYSVIARGLPKGHSKAVTCIATSPDHKMVASGSEDTRIKLWLLDGRELAMLEGHSGSITALTFSPDGSRLVSSSTDCALKIWDVFTGSIVCTLYDQLKTIRSTSFSPDGRLFVSCALDCSVKLWDTASWTSVTFQTAQLGAPIDVTFCSNSTFLGCGYDDATIGIWDISLREICAVLRGHTGPVTSVAFSPDNTTIVSTSEDCTVRVWEDWNTSQPLCDVVTSDDGTVGSAGYSPDGRLIAFCSAGNAVSIWDAESRMVVRSAEVDVGMKTVEFSPCGQWVRTDRGTFRVHHAPHSPRDRAIFFAQLVTKDWVFKGSEQILWLPDAHRATCVVVAEEITIMGHDSGAISFLDFSNLPQDNSSVSSVHTYSGTSITESPSIGTLPPENFRPAELAEAQETSHSRSGPGTVFGVRIDDSRPAAAGFAVVMISYIAWCLWMSKDPSPWSSPSTPLLAVFAITIFFWFRASTQRGC